MKTLNVDTGGPGAEIFWAKNRSLGTKTTWLLPLAFAGVLPHSTLAGSLVISSINSIHQLEELVGLCFNSNSIVVVRSIRHIMTGGWVFWPGIQEAGRVLPVENNVTKIFTNINSLTIHWAL